MAQFDVSFLNPKLRKAGGGSQYGVLVDSLDILESKLEADGKLSPGDYTLLTNKAQELYAAPGLSADQRSNIEVKIERYKSQKSKNGLNDASNITALNDSVSDDRLTANMILANKPDKLLDTNIVLARAKVNQLKEAADAKLASGDVGASTYMLQYNEALTEYNDLLDIKEKLKGRAAGAPIPGYAAYITTNAKGEITDVKFGATGSMSGYAETNGVYGGLQVYGKARKEGDKMVFRMGRESFSAANIMIPDPTNPGSFTTKQLTADSQKTGGKFTRSQAGVYHDVDLATVRSQTSVPVGSYAEGSNGFFYRAMPDGTYHKIVNATPEKLGISDSDFVKLPKSYESSVIIPQVSDTEDWSQPAPLPLPPTIGPSSPTPMTDASATTVPAQNADAAAQGGATGTTRTKSPTERAPGTAGGVAEKSQAGAKGFFQRLFSGYRGGI